MFRIELTDAQENLLTYHDYTSRKQLNIVYNNIVNNIGKTYDLNNCIIKVYQYINGEELKELKNYSLYL